MSLMLGCKCPIPRKEDKKEAGSRQSRPNIKVGAATCAATTAFMNVGGMQTIQNNVMYSTVLDYIQCSNILKQGVSH